MVGETYFFREQPGLEALCEHAAAPAIAAHGRARLWCAASATGEEPLTLSMLLARQGLLDRTTVVASDISQRSLDRARQGAYRSWALRRPLEPEEQRWFEISERGFQFSPALIERVEWHRLNLLDREAIGDLGLFDGIACRNVLIYFREDTVRKVIENLVLSLKPGGLLLLGASESVLRLRTDLVLERLGGAFLYRRPNL